VCEIYEKNDFVEVSLKFS